jgi:DNA polymerase III delta prime subunit
VKKMLKGYASKGGGGPLLFVGKSGTGKSEMARVLAKQMSASVQIINPGEANKEGLETLRADRGLFDGEDTKRRLVVIDHVDMLTARKQVDLRPWVDGYLAHKSTIWVLIAQDETKIEEGLSSRCQKMHISTYGNAKAASAHLQHIWDNEVTDQNAKAQLRPHRERSEREP